MVDSSILKKIISKPNRMGSFPMSKYLNKTNFRILLLITVLSEIGFAILHILILENLNHPLLAKYNNTVVDDSLSNLGIILLVAFFIAYVSSYIALFLFKDIGRVLWVLVIVLTVFPFPIQGFELGSSEITPFTGTFEYFVGILNGAILALIYLSPIAHEFKNQTPS